ncbi:MAG: ATP-binding protein [Synechococcales bacterium]|nr:ATP-binding protein [Synechococcales bacterium]
MGEATRERVETVDLTNCDREPIHIPGLVQPHGVLLVLQDPTLEIVQVSSNTQEIIGHAPQTLLGQPLGHLLDGEQVKTVQQCLAENFESMNPLDLTIHHPGGTADLDGIVHRSDGVIILELEKKQTENRPDFLDFYHQVRGTITRIQQAPSLVDMCQVVVQEVRRITGFDRVMVYQFDPEGAGIVVAEATNQATPYLGLRYPSSDIPKQARELYTRNWLRLIPDSQYQPATLIPAQNPVTQKPLNLSLAVLRSVSPIHLEYLHNMGVTASMSISLIRDRQLWGLIACHHASPKYVPCETRTACEFIGQVMSVELANKETSEDRDYALQLKALQTELVDTLSQAEYFLEGMARLDKILLRLVNATGAVVFSGDRSITIGDTPTEADTHALLDWIKPHLHHNLFETRSLIKDYPAAAAFKAIASGVLALEISRIHHNYILWFRPEVIQTVNWGGNPNKPVEVQSDGSFHLSPRKSFELWQETVRGCSLPWRPCELEAVIELRSMIVGLVLRQADELALMNFKLRRSNEELDSFAYIASHDLKEPLRGIHNYANFLMEDYGDILEEDGIAKLQTLVRLSQRMEDLINSLLHYSRLDRAELIRQPVDLDDLVQHVIATLTIAHPQSQIEFRIPQPLPEVECDRSQVTELYSNLISNAIKYNDKAEKWIEIGWFERELGSGSQEPGGGSQEPGGGSQEPGGRRREAGSTVLPAAGHSPNPKSKTQNPKSKIFYVRDNGIGIAEEHLDKVFQIFRRLHGRDAFGGGTGAGLTIARKIAERHDGRIWIESIPGQGSTFYFTLSAEDVVR